MVFGSDWFWLFVRPSGVERGSKSVFLVSSFFRDPLVDGDSWWVELMVVRLKGGVTHYTGTGMGSKSFESYTKAATKQKVELVFKNLSISSEPPL